MWRQGRNSQENNNIALGQGPGSPSRDTHNEICELFCRYRWEELTVCCPQALRPQTPWNQEVDDADSHLPHHQPVRRTSTSCSRPLWTTTIKLLTTHLQGGTHSFEGISPLWPPLPAKAIKLLFSTSPKTLSRRFNSVYRDTEAGFGFSGDDNDNDDKKYNS